MEKAIIWAQVYAQVYTAAYQLAEEKGYNSDYPAIVAERAASAAVASFTISQQTNEKQA